MNYDLALEIGEKMGVLDGFPMLSKAIVQVGEFIFSLCKTDAEAEWLLAEVTTSGKHTKWGGPGWLKQIHAAQFGNPVDDRSPNALPVYKLDTSYEPMSDAEREEYAAMERAWSKGKPPKPLPVEKPAARELTDAELAALMTRTPEQIRESLKAKVTQ